MFARLGNSGSVSWAPEKTTLVGEIIMGFCCCAISMFFFSFFSVFLLLLIFGCFFPS